MGAGLILTARLSRKAEATMCHIVEGLHLSKGPDLFRV